MSTRRNWKQIAAEVAATQATPDPTQRKTVSQAADRGGDLDWPRLLAVARIAGVRVWRADTDGTLRPVTEPPTDRRAA